MAFDQPWRTRSGRPWALDWLRSRCEACLRRETLSRDMTVAIEMGNTTAGAPATLDLEELLATRLLVQGNSGSGKSHLLRRLLEQSAPWVQHTIIAPYGDFVSLADRFDHLVIDAEQHT